VRSRYWGAFSLLFTFLERNHLRNTKHQTLTLVGDDEVVWLRVTGYGLQVTGNILRITAMVTHT